MTTHVLILCTHNSARSILGECMLNHWARKLGRDVRAHSAGSTLGGRVNPFAIDVLANAGVDVSACRSKSWDTFARADAQTMRVVITVCDNAAAEACPLWPGSPVKIHWGYPDPSNAPEADRKAAFELTRQAIGYRALQLLALPLATMGDDQLRTALVEIAQS